MLRDVMQSSGLAAFAEVGLLIFLVTFVVVVLRVVSQRRGHYDTVARLPLHDESIEPPSSTRPPVSESCSRGGR